jgi:hypothetical protein
VQELLALGDLATAHLGIVVLLLEFGRRRG